MNIGSGGELSGVEDFLSESELMVITKECSPSLLNEMGLLMEDPERFHIKDEPEPVVEKKEIGVFQSPTGQFPCTDEWCGEYNFEFFADSRTSSKKTWLYSFQLNKIFVDVNQGIPLQFKLDHRVDGEKLYVRALAIYNVTQHLHLPVNRCPNHLREDEDRGLSNIHHVLQCRDERADYHYDSASKRYSVVVPLEHPPAGSDVTTLMYCLTCKGSCAGGMNRRPVTLIFTLERENQQVVGRRTLNIRVCSCPKRDKKKEEAELKEEKAIQMIQADSKKRKMLKPKPPQTPSDDELSLPKRRKSLLSVSSDSVQDSKVYNIQVTGTQHYIEVLKHLIMLKTYEWVETSSPEAQESKEEYEKMLEMALK
ncbi:cellular tumor antigen p53 isoform X2 [Ischnura elegans]|uniref:cellular tumor antigen p53 isoform X2 n=1 Tax=Ischnura elegans TaxID=197161 RepID=UPI001ED8B3C8|nr:cellular tumor antigen p53 isoform X2 [Ischnura elegans]